jgi:hypothetical protein
MTERAAMIERARQFGFEDAPIRASGMAADFALAQSAEMRQEIERLRGLAVERRWRAIETCETCLHPVSEHLDYGYAGITHRRYCCDGCDGLNIGLINGQKVIIQTRSGRLYFSKFTTDHHPYFIGQRNHELVDVAAWMPLPEPYLDHQSQEGGE